MTPLRRRCIGSRFRRPALRPFHYITVRLTPRGLAVTVRGLHPGAERLHTMERFRWPWPVVDTPPRAAPASR